MAYHDDLLQQAIDLAHKNPKSPTQADLRRSVSAAYYALFHLLISETVAHWSLATSRDALGRMFEHSVMRKVSGRISDSRLFPICRGRPHGRSKRQDCCPGFCSVAGQAAHCRL